MGKFGWLVELPQQAGVTELNVGCVDCGEFFSRGELLEGVLLSRK